MRLLLGSNTAPSPFSFRLQCLQAMIFIGGLRLILYGSGRHKLRQDLDFDVRSGPYTRVEDMEARRRKSDEAA
jgi:hypothetical protein